MPLVDMPLERLLEYRGTNPRPEDFDSYWARAIAELDDTPATPRFESASFQCPFAHCDHLWFTGVEGARLHAKCLRPKRDARGTVLMFHGYSVSSGDWAEKLSYVAAGWNVLALDVRGQGGLSEDPGARKGTTLRGHIIRGLDDDPDRLLYRSIFLDTAQLARIAKSFGGEIVTFGASQGGGLAIACAALDPTVKRVVAWYPFLCDYLRVWQMDLARDAYDEIQSWFRRHDPTHRREQEVFARLGYIDVQHLASKVSAAVVMATGLMDTVCPPSTQFAAYNKLGGPKEVTIYPDFGHEGLPGMTDTTFSFLTGSASIG